MKHIKEEKTFVLVKPDGVRKGLIGEVIKRFEQRDLKIVALEMFMPTRNLIDEHYPKAEEWVERLGTKTLSTYEKYGIDAKKELGTDDAKKIGAMVREWLLDYMTSAPLVRMAVQGTHAVDVVRKIAGPTLPYVADMGTIRGDFSIDSPAIANSEKRAVMNILHCSETPQEAEHEIKHWFGTSHMHDYKRHGVDE
ncbi:nucleoside-diphosphate kinase [Candidatus Kaiserbacteria bacterium RIFCSPHIGHO2_02_FULL_59_21]|uniref:nucleoside-diphosphate kinase n=2 Tax=Candidatus Kaiseribacteriota TaxID=1752734 RepID=A0A1F6DYZ6_9BACT|nr:MAG: nucleoside-diphosphate kinase [Candidatus Kaiserbacteria bacterium RIFCSPHIGHO2_01_FULL_58_22]OGG66649.1 MAG: nucleoside-diphosphate kinase [Candidatus Kaiserbacteria bacterium RIFCSPHIGHO2_02_FULL_59_21]OGG78976.1 MAG: nucleoside-diphosphate kinase [Candidatus Kaiserbacteria bacterium RIFCSPLOWO2_01_FULL_59_34]OGG84400.1 MAG: nucleoside-diphosphate kinase [Candidatus Kaiserbacteria bacterium RIFCSPLOWO2_02_FULL_59_19]